MDCEESHLGNTIRCTSHYFVRDGQVVQPWTEDIAPSDSPDCREVDPASSHHKRQHQPKSSIAYSPVTRRRFSASQTLGFFLEALPFLRSVVDFCGAGAPPLPFAMSTFLLQASFRYGFNYTSIPRLVARQIDAEWLASMAALFSSSS